MIRFPDFGVIFLVHGPTVALKAGIAEGDDIAGADLVVLLHRGVRHVGVDEGAVGTDADGEEGVGKGFQEFQDQGVGCSVADGAVLLGVGTVGDAEAESFVGVLELVLTRACWWRLVALF